MDRTPSILARKVKNMTDQTRKAFEAEIRKNKAAFQLIRVASGEYQSGSTQELWEYWQAATAVERKPLSDAELQELFSGTPGFKQWALTAPQVNFARSIEREHGIGKPK